MIDHNRKRREAAQAALRARAEQPPESRMRAWHAGQPEGENKRITGRYIDAMEDASAEGELTQKRINERMGI